MAIQQQVHERFKVFVGDNIDEVNRQVQEFSSQEKIAAKSIGVEYVESHGQVVVSLGYTEDPEGYGAALRATSAGMLELHSADSREELERKLASVAATTNNVICHELYMTESGEVFIVFLTVA